MLILVLLLFAVPLTQGFGSFACSTEYHFTGTPLGGTQHTPPNTKICFIGDNNRHGSLDVVVVEGCEAVVHAGDFDYWDDPELFMKQIWDVLPEDYPYYVTMGNHDVTAFDGEKGYQKLLMDQLVRSGMHTQCVGEVAVNQICSYKGILILGTAVGTCAYSAPSHIDFINSAFQTYGSAWKICNHHKNQRLYQVGGKGDETGYAVLDACRQHGAILHTGHEHSYARTVEMHSYQDFQYNNATGWNPTMRTGVAGTSFLFVSGLGGESIREWEDNLQLNHWWASTATISGCTGYCENEGRDPTTPVMDGVLVCNFNNNGNPNETHCYFKDIAGRLWDDFMVYSQVPDAPSVSPADLSCAAPFVEYTVTESGDDGVLFYEKKLEVTDQTILTMDGRSGSAWQFTIRNISIDKSHDRLVGAWLQVYSANNAYLAGVAPKVTIKASHRDRVAATVVGWTEEAEDWERHTVWVTNDIKTIIEEIIARPDWHGSVGGDDITFVIEAEDDLIRQIYALERGKWFAPTLAVEMESGC